MSVQKSRVTEAFSRSAHRYDQASQVQADVARDVAELALQGLAEDPRILEIGCGTGGLTAHLLAGVEGGAFKITDIAPAMVAACRDTCADSRAAFTVLDGENPDLGGQTFDLIVSSLAMQWFVDLPGGIARLCDHLAPGGRLVFSTLGVDTFATWRRAHRDLGLQDGTPNYPTVADLEAMWPMGGQGEVTERRIERPYSDARTFARRLKTIGANTPKDGHRPLSPKEFRKIAAHLGEDFTDTYHILYATVRVRD